MSNLYKTYLDADVGNQANDAMAHRLPNNAYNGGESAVSSSEESYGGFSTAAKRAKIQTERTQMMAVKRMIFPTMPINLCTVEHQSHMPNT